MLNLLFLTAVSEALILGRPDRLLVALLAALTLEVLYRLALGWPGLLLFGWAWWSMAWPRLLVDVLWRLARLPGKDAL